MIMSAVLQNLSCFNDYLNYKREDKIMGVPACDD